MAALTLAVAAERAVPQVFGIWLHYGQMHTTALAAVTIQQRGLGSAIAAGPDFTVALIPHQSHINPVTPITLHTLALVSAPLESKGGDYIDGASHDPDGHL